MASKARTCAVLVLSAVALALHGQDVEATETCSFGFNGYATSSSDFAGSQPFTAVVRWSYELKLADGNAIRTFAVTRRARDSRGRTFAESGPRCGPDAQGKPVLTYAVNIFDPESRDVVSWSLGPGQPKITHVRQRPVMAVRTRQTAEAHSPPISPNPAAKEEFQNEDLGDRDIAGVQAHGRRHTRIVPAGQDGNQRELRVVEETWVSPEFGRLLYIRDDPREGRMTIEVEQLMRGEPDANLFTPPAENTVEDRTSGTAPVAAPPKP